VVGQTKRTHFRICFHSTCWICCTGTWCWMGTWCCGTPTWGWPWNNFFINAI